MTNVLFLTFYYAMIFPAGFFWASATLSVRYWVDKLCLLRTWSPAPALGSSIADLSREFFFPGAVVAYAIMSSYNFASFPYDNACKLDDVVSSEYVGDFSGQTAEGQSVEFSIAEGERIFHYCNQDMLRFKPWPAFPAVPSSQPAGGEWMASGQDFTIVLGWSAIVVIAFVLIMYLNALRNFLRGFFYGGFVSHDIPQGNGFSASPDIFGYIPQFKLASDLFPTLLCDISGIRHDLIDWEDPSDPSKKTHNAIYDIVGVTKRSEAESVLSIVREW